MNFFNKLERKLGRFAIPNLIAWVIGCYILGIILSYTAPQALNMLTLEPYMIFHHAQIWRLVTWIVVPYETNILFALIMMYFYFQLGTTLERHWGAFRFNVYIIGGMIFTVIGAIILYFILGQQAISLGSYFSTYYINLSIFLAFSVCFPDMRVLLMFVIPIKMKWLAVVYVVFAAYSAVLSNAAGRVAIMMSLLNFLIFFLMTRNHKYTYNPKQAKQKHEFKKQMNQSRRTQQTGSGHYAGGARHKCAVCGRTELDDPNLEFRYCSKCSGNYEYCQDHLFTHVHK